MHHFGRLRALFAVALALSGALALTGVPAPLAGVAPAIAGIAGPDSAYAGTWDLMSCSANGSPAPIEGWVSSGAGNNSGAYNSCAAGGTFGSGISGAVAQPAGLSIVWTFTPPAGSTIVGGTISGGLVVPYGKGGGAYFAAPTADYSPSDVLANCQWNLPCPQSVAPPGPGSYAGTFPINPGGLIYAIASCLGLPGGAGCPGGFGPPVTAGVIIASATIALTNNATPAGSGFAGGLLAPGPVSGTQAITFVATDPGGPGVYNVSVSVDSTPIFSGSADSSGHCTSVGTDAAGNREFLYARPCPGSVAILVPVPTVRFPDGKHTVTATITDAAGNTSQVLSTPIDVKNRTTVSAGLAAGYRPAAGVNGNGGPPAPVYAVVLDRATHALTHGFHRKWADSAVTVSGTLRNSSGVPVPGVPLTLLAQNGGVGERQAIAHATSDATGHWTLNAGQGPSRALAITYGTQAQAAAVEAGVTLRETVTPGLTLYVRHLGHGGLRFTGRLSVSPLGNPRPLVQIETKSKKDRGWQAFGHFVTVNPAGGYRLDYTALALAIGSRFKFRAVSVATSLFTAATSSTRETVVR